MKLLRNMKFLRSLITKSYNNFTIIGTIERESRVRVYVTFTPHTETIQCNIVFEKSLYTWISEIL